MEFFIFATMECLNCGTPLQGKFCYQCGQKADTRPITFRAIFSDLAKGIFNAEKGLFYNLKNLTIAPASMVDAYLKGSRTQVYPPIQYAILGVALLTVVDINFRSALFNLQLSEEIKQMDSFQWGYEFGVFLRQNLKYLWLLNIFFFALPAALIFQRFNLAEHVIISAFVIGHAAFLTLLLFPVLNWTILANPVNYLAVWMMYALILRKTGNIWEVAVLSFVVVLLGTVLFLIVPILFFGLFRWIQLTLLFV